MNMLSQSQFENHKHSVKSQLSDPTLGHCEHGQRQNANDLLTELASILNAEYRHDGDYHADCPFCGKPVKHRCVYFTFGLNSFYCFSCGDKDSLPVSAICKLNALESYCGGCNKKTAPVLIFADSTGRIG